MNKSDLIKAVAAQAGLTQKQTAQAFDIAFDIIKSTLATGEKVQLSGLGTFEAKARAARLGRNPRTNETVEVPANKVPVFKAAQAFKDAVKD